MTVPRLPPQLHVFVRDWLSANNIVLRSSAGNVVIDTGYSKHVPLTLALVASRQGMDGDPLTKIINTHCHSDHMGGNAALKRAYGCPIALPRGEVDKVRDWNGPALLLGYADQAAERFIVDEVIEPGSTHVWGDLEWQAVAAPGHDMGAVVFFNGANGILISGDALWRDGYGFVMPPAIDPEALPATRATLDVIARLPVRSVIPGHGEPFTEVGPALERAYARTAAFEEDPMRLARHAVRVVLTFSLLDKERIALDGLPAYLERVPIYRDFNERFFRRDLRELATWLVDQLVRVGAARMDGNDLVPT